MSDELCRNALAPRGMCRCRTGWTTLCHERELPELPWETKTPHRRPPPDKFTPAMWRMLHPDTGYPTLMDLVVQELLAPAQGGWPSAAP